MREGSEALRYFDQLKSAPAEWQNAMEWYRGLSLFLSGERAKAIELFEKMATTEGHFFRKQSEKALRKL